MTKTTSDKSQVHLMKSADSITNSGLIIMSARTEMSIFKNLKMTYVQDGEEITEFDNFEDAYKYFLACHLRSIFSESETQK